MLVSQRSTPPQDTEQPESPNIDKVSTLDESDWADSYHKIIHARPLDASSLQAFRITLGPMSPALPESSTMTTPRTPPSTPDLSNVSEASVYSQTSDDLTDSPAIRISCVGDVLDESMTTIDKKYLSPPPYSRQVELPEDDQEETSPGRLETRHDC